MKSRRPDTATPPLTCPWSFATHCVAPVLRSSAHTRPSQSPTYTVPPTTSGEDSDGPIVRCQITRPVPTAYAATSPVREAAGWRLHGGGFRYVWKTTWWSSAGDAATHRCVATLHARLPFFAPTANRVPALLAKNSRP